MSADAVSNVSKANAIFREPDNDNARQPLVNRIASLKCKPDDSASSAENLQRTMLRQV
jgi:hypothetical protein